jgi:Zn-dependent M28 family amino/carboxypeptidase
MIIKKILILILGIGLVFQSCNQPSKKTSHTSPKSAKKTIQVDVPAFNADSAYHFVKSQTDFGPRVPNTEAHRKCADYLTRTMERFADTVIVQNMQVRAYNGTLLNAKNIISSFHPQKTKRILLAAHWDSRPYADHDPDQSNRWKPIAGANDGASGVGVLMEIARVMKNQKPNVGIDIIFFDAEDYGTPQSMQSSRQDTWALGSQYWAKNPHKYGYKAHYGILLDMVGAADAVFLQEKFSVRFAPDIVDKVWLTAAQLGYESYFPRREGGSINDDQYYINEFADIPMIDIIHLDPNSKNGTFFDHWHTLEDSIDKINPATLRIVGEVVLHVVYQE